MKNLAIIPARSGSKGLPDKNIRDLAGKPLMAYSIEAAIQSGMFDTVHVSTDSERYASIARSYGADVPFLRSAEASTDTASSWTVVKEVLEQYISRGKKFDSFMLMQPTSPLRTAEHIREAYLELGAKKANAIVSLCQVEHSPLQCNTLPADLSLDNFLREVVREKRRQELEVFYRINGAIYLARTDCFLETGDIYASKCYAYIMSKSASIDIDEEIDLIIAETLLCR